MALGSIIYRNLLRNRFIDPVDSSIVLNIDVTDVINHNESAQVTKNPVSSLEQIADHVILNPIVLSITGTISDSPLAASFFSSTANNPLRNAVRNKGSVGGFLDAANQSRSQLAFEYLEELRENRLPLTFVTKLKSYKNMIITNININRQRGSGGTLPFIVTMEEVKIVSFALLAFKPDAIDGASNEDKNAGKKSTKPPSEQNRNTTSNIIAKSFGI